MTDTLPTRLLRAITAVEVTARAAGGVPWSEAVPGMIHIDAAFMREHRAWRSAVGYVASVERGTDRHHMAIHSPAAVLRRCAADRKLLELHYSMELSEEMMDVCAECDVADWPCPTLRHLAEGYGLEA